MNASKTTHLLVGPFGLGFAVYRVDESRAASTDNLDLVECDGKSFHKSRRAANNAAKKIAASTGEEVR